MFLNYFENKILFRFRVLVTTSRNKFNFAIKSKIKGKHSGKTLSYFVIIIANKSNLGVTIFSLKCLRNLFTRS